MTLEEKILSKNALVSVIGLGYVGLPLAIEFCKAGYHVIGLDTNNEKIGMLLEGKSYVQDVPTNEIQKAMEDQLLIPSNNFNLLNDVDAVSICVPTPLGKSKEPNVSFILLAIKELETRLHRNMIVILESTTYPGTTEELIQPVVKKQGFIVGKDVYICYSPERVDPGNEIFKTRNTPKIIGGITPTCTKMGTLLYSQVIDKVVNISSAKAAEMVKLLENTYRAVNIGLINEMALMCQRMGVDIWEVIDAAATKPFGFMPFYPGPGIGGHCIPLDPMYLSWKAKMYNFYNRFIEMACDVNGNMPRSIVQRINEILNLEGKAISNSNILCLGLSYKKDVNDARETPSLDVIQLLEEQGARVEYNDPYISYFNEDAIQKMSVPLTKENINNADCVVLLTDHTRYDYDFIAEHARLIMDTRNAFKGIKNPRIMRIGCPLPTVMKWKDEKRLTEGMAAVAKDE